MKIFIIKRIIIAVSINLFYSIILSLTCAGVLLAEESKGQYKSIKEVFITVDLSEVPIKKVFDAIEKQTDFKFTYKKELLTQAATSKLTVKSGRKSVAFVLKKIANETGFSFKQHNNIIGVHNILPKKSPDVKSQKILPDRVLYSAMGHPSNFSG